MKKSKKSGKGILISGLGNVKISARGNTVSVTGVDAESHVEQVSVSVNNPRPKVRLQNVSNDSVILVNGERVN